MFKYRDKQQLLTTTKQLAEVHGKQRQNTQMYYAAEMCGNEYSLNGTIARDVRTRKFGHLHLRHFVRLPHHYHSLENSRTFQDLALKFPGLSRTWKMYPKKSRTFQERGIPVSTVLSQFVRVTDGRTDGQTDRILIARPCLHSMQCCKNFPTTRRNSIVQRPYLGFAKYAVGHTVVPVDIWFSTAP